MSKKQYVVVGVGRFGSALLEQLANMNQQVLVIDSDAEMIQMINENRLATEAVIADATNESVMRKLLCTKDNGKSDYDVGIVCIGENIEASLLVTVILKELGIKKVIAKVASDIHGRILEKILHVGTKGGDEVLYPYKDIAELVATRLVRPNIQEELNISADYKFMRVTPPKNVVGKTIVQADLRAKHNINVIAIKSANTESVDFNIRPNTVIKSDDTLLVTIPNSVIDKFLKEE